MKKLKIAYYLAEYGDSMDKAIDMFSGKLGYSHTELVIDKHTTIGSSYLNGGVGVFKYNNILTSKKWHVVEYDVPAEIAIAYAYTLLGRKYDTLGVLSHFFGIDKGESDTKMWCSELTTLCFMIALYSKLNIKSDIPIKDTLLMPNESYSRLYSYKNDDIVLKASIDTDDLVYYPAIDRYDRVEYNEDNITLESLLKKLKES